MEALRAKAKEAGAAPFLTFRFDAAADILDPVQSTIFCKFLDFMWEHTRGENSDARVDMKLVLDKKIFTDLLSPQDRKLEAKYSVSNLQRKLNRLYAAVQNTTDKEAKIALRMTRGPTKACIAFHCDGNYATSTSQVALNDPSEYEGGKLCYFVNDTVHFLERPVGSLAQHAPKVLHGVSNLTGGTRKSLFLVDQNNGLGDKDIHIVVSTEVQDFQQAQCPKLPLCLICTQEPANHVLVPCGHVCLCEECLENEINRCPICRMDIQAKQKLFL